MRDRSVTRVGTRRGLRALALGTTVLLIALGARVAPAVAVTTITVGPNVNISKSATHNSEGTIAVDPTNTNRVFMTSNVNGAGILAGYSVNGGTTWTTYTLGAGADGFPPACCDGQAVFDNLGNLFLVYLSLAPTREAVVLRSVNGGQTFVIAGTLAASGADQPSVDAGAGAVWVTFRGAGSVQASGAAVTGLGTVGAFSALQAAPGSGTGSFGDIAISPTGQVFVTYQSPASGQGPASILGNLDADGLGAGGFGPAVTLSGTNVGGFDFIPPQPARSVDSEASLEWDRSGGPANGRLHLVYTEETVNENNDLDILHRFSTDGGLTWSAPSRVNDDGPGRVQFLPGFALDQSTGNSVVCWYDTRNDGPGGSGNVVAGLDNDAQYWCSASDDGGVTWAPNVKVSTGTSNGPASGNPNEYGDYTFVSAAGGVASVIWSDNSNSTGDNPAGVLGAHDMYTARLGITAAAAVTTVCTAPPAPGTPIPGYNVVNAAPGGAVTSGTPGPDVIYGTPGPDRLAGLGGDDLIFGYGGNDQISGGDGNDRLCGGDGNDQISGGAGNDLLSGDAGDDDLSGGAGDDQLIGGAGTDRETGGDGNDTCRPGSNPASQTTGCETLLPPI